MSPMKSRYSVILEYLKMIKMPIIMKIMMMTICVCLCGSGDDDNYESKKDER